MTTKPPSAALDLREACYNNRAIGPAHMIQLPAEAVTTLHGLVVDLDANVLNQNPWFPPAASAEAFFAGIDPVIQRHPILKQAEIRCTGRGLHAIVQFDPLVEIHTAGEQQQWAKRHRVLRATVPSDPAAPILIALTRPVGSVNSKNGAEVRTLREGTPIHAEALLDWLTKLAAKPFEIIGTILFGQKRIHPCPYCGGADSYLDLGDVAGFCYGPCRRIGAKEILAPFYRMETESSAATGAQKGKKSSRKKAKKSK